MGDIADEHYDQIIDEMCERGYGWVGVRHSYGPRVTCKYCDSPRVFWKRVNGEYVLYNKDTNEPHKCPAIRLENTPDGFEDEPTDS